MSFSDFYNTRTILTEASTARRERYSQMFNKFNDPDTIDIKDSITKKEITKVVSKAMQELKKDNVVIWLLKQYRKSLESAIELMGSNYYNSSDNDNLTKMTLISKLTFTYYQFISSITHFRSLNLPSINYYNYGDKPYNEVVEDFTTYENEWQESRRGTIDITDDIRSGRGGGKKIIDCGDNYGWYDLEKNYCTTEGNAMGHCGNSAAFTSFDTVLSFRKVEKIKGRVIAKPSMTFILDTRSRQLGEMKGRGNKKPIDKYHPAIIKLLTHRYTNSLGIRGWFIDGIVGGGYAPEENFNLRDLSDKDRDTLFSIRPDLRPLSDILKRDGIEVLMGILIPKLKTLYPDNNITTYTQKGRYESRDYIRMGSVWTDWGDLLDSVGEPRVLGRYRMEVGEDGYNSMWDNYEEIDTNTKRDFFITVCRNNMVIKNRIMKHIRETYDEEPNDDSEMFEILMKHEDDIIDTINSSINYGMNVGVEKQMYERFKEGIENISLDFLGDDEDNDGFVRFSNPEQWHDSTIDLLLTTSEVCSLVDQGISPIEGVTHDDGDMEEPYHGFDGYDEEAAIGNFADTLDI